MKRSFTRFTSREYDLLVVGGGIYGIACAREAALRGLRVGIIEMNDYGGQTSSNSAKIAHCGMRYLQHLDLARMRESIRERNHMHQLAPQFVRSQPFLMPIYGHGIKGKEVLSIYIKVYDWLSPERKRFKDDFRKVPDSRVISRDEVIALFPKVRRKGLTGGVVWYEGQMHNTERLLFSILCNAKEHGAECINYAEAVRIRTANNTVKGVDIRDLLTQEEAFVPCRHLINAAGPWSTKIFKKIDHKIQDHGIYASKAFSILTEPVSDGVAITFPIRSMYNDEKAVVDKKSSLQFAIPWRGKTMFASLHLPCDDEPEAVTITESELNAYLNRINEGFPGSNLKLSDINHVLWGIIPADRKGSAAPLKHYKIIDHGKADGLTGLTTVVGVKFTTARDVAVKAIKSIEAYLEIPKTKSNSETIPFSGGDIAFYEKYVNKTLEQFRSVFSEELTVRLIETYGTQINEIAALAIRRPELNEVIADGPIIKAQVVYAIENEMAQRLADVVLRRTDMGSRQHPGTETLRAVAHLMANELGWDQSKIQAEIEHTNSCYLVLS